MSYFPFFVEIGQKRCLVVGGGTVAFRKGYEPEAETLS